jgi:uncharacterized integral membrane protein (TIGR00698 family)
LPLTPITKSNNLSQNAICLCVTKAITFAFVMKAIKILYFLAFTICFSPFISASAALLIGFLFCLILGNPFENQSANWGGYLLKASVIGLGFGINFNVLQGSAKENISTTTIFVLGVLLLGIFLGKVFKIEKTTTILIAAGTAICGGSAIIAIGAILKANSNQIATATGAVFLLNAIALFVFPPLGHYFNLSQEQFGLWAAIAIHDTSSVVGAATKYGDVALNIASITKMLRIIWIIPVSLILVFGYKENRETFKIPLFILGFIAASLIHSYMNILPHYHEILYSFAKQGLVASLFIIGSNITIGNLKKIGGNIFSLAITLWLIVCVISLIFIKFI